MPSALLGIGLGDAVLDLQDGHVGNDGKATGYGPYRLEASKALFVSGGVLVVGLAGMLIVMPLNG